MSHSNKQKYQQMKNIAGAIDSTCKLSEQVKTQAAVVKANLHKISQNDFATRPADKIMDIQRLKLSFSKLENLLQKELKK